MEIDVQDVIKRAFPPISVKNKKLEEINSAGLEAKIDRKIQKYGTLHEFMDTLYFHKKLAEYKQKEEEGYISYKLNPSVKPIKNSTKGEKACTIIITIQGNEFSKTEKVKDSLNFSNTTELQETQSDYKINKKNLLEENLEMQRKKLANIIVKGIYEEVLVSSNASGAISCEQQLMQDMKESYAGCNDKGFISEYHDKFKKSFDFAKSCILHTSLSTQKIAKSLKIIEDNYVLQKSSNSANKMTGNSSKNREMIEKGRLEKQVKGSYSTAKKVSTSLETKCYSY